MPKTFLAEVGKAQLEAQSATSAIAHLPQPFSPKIAKNAIFALCREISIEKVRLRFDLVRKCRSAIAELRCASTESKSSLRKSRCALEIKKIQLRTLNCAFTG